MGSSSQTYLHRGHWEVLEEATLVVAVVVVVAAPDRNLSGRFAAVMGKKNRYIVPAPTEAATC